MDASLHRLLVAFDEPGCFESPSDMASSFSWQLMDQILVKLSALAERPLDVDRSVQDASFLTDIGLLDERGWDRSTRTGVVAYEFAFRFSNFGFLFTTHGSHLTEWEEVLVRGTDLIEAHGGTFVSADALNTPYDGPNSETLHEITWWTRYFDYL